MALMLVVYGSSILIFSSASVLAEEVRLQSLTQQVNLGANAEFRCIHEGTDVPYWLIGDRLYNIFDLPDGKYVYAERILTVKHVDEDDNGTQIQCVFSTRASNILTLSVSTIGSGNTFGSESTSEENTSGTTFVSESTSTSGATGLKSLFAMYLMTIVFSIR